MFHTWMQNTTTQLTLLLEASIGDLHFGDKGTTKNTHTQAKRGIIYKKDRYLSHSTLYTCRKLACE
jgi:hypothetical protein